MTAERRQSLEIPADDHGRLGRECPRCHDQFKIDIERYEDRGFMNLRCPYCKFIAELDRFTTGEQRQYMYATTQNLALRTMEDLLEDTFGDISGFSSDHVELEVTGGDVDFGRVAAEPPFIETAVEDVTCDDCGFSYSVMAERDGVCPVCR